MEYYSAINKEGNNATHSNVDGPGDSRTNEVIERQILYAIAYMWNLKYEKNALNILPTISKLT